MYHGVQYNIPVDLFISESHPVEAPKLYVRPTSNMTVKQNHQHVSANGLCYLPYLHEWTDRSNLVSLIEITSSVFSIEPPLFSKPPASSTPSPSPSSHSNLSGRENSYNANPSPYPMATTSSSSAIHYASFTPVALSTTPNASPTSGMAATASASAGNAWGIGQMTSNLSNASLRSEEDKRLELVDQVTMRLYEAIDNKQRILRDELDNQISLGGKLATSSDAALKALSEQVQLKVDTAEAIEKMNGRIAALDKWCSEEGSKPPPPAIERLEPFDPVSAQIVRISSEVNSIDDAFYFLERALASSRNESVDLNTFLKECRLLARKQFLGKAHLRKINAHCLQLEVEHAGNQASAAPIPEYHQQQQGSGWR